ncbi:MAG: DUF3142 domain-containing protein [Fimbriimonadaceae bacterium]|nr:DUF3142 domain-containing protein [Fimbriimonadaceae bacterium]
MDPRFKYDELYVLAGTVGYGEEGLRWTFRQRWISQPSPRVWLVFNADSGMLRHFGDESTRKVADHVLAEYDRQRQIVQSQGGEVVGIQLDFDVPTRRLPRYRELLRRIQSRVREKTSITLLQSWVFDSRFAGLAREVDEVVPQFYEGYLVSEPLARARLVDFDQMDRVLGKLDAMEVPFRVGIARHRQALQATPDGRIVGSHRGVPLAEIYRDPRFTFTSVRQRGYEVQVAFRATEPGRDGKGLGYQIVYFYPDPALHEATELWLSQKRFRYIAGTIDFRLSGPAERDVMLPSDPLGSASMRVSKPLRDGSGLVDGGPILLNGQLEVSLPPGYAGLAPDALVAHVRIGAGELLVWGEGLPNAKTESSTRIPGHFGPHTVRVPIRIGLPKDQADKPVEVSFQVELSSTFGGGASSKNPSSGARQSLAKRVIWMP